MGGGGDGGYGERQDEQDRKKQAARNAVNVAFGVAPTGSTVRREDFTSTVEDPGVGDSGPSSSSVFDQVGYDAAVAAEAAQGADAVKNKSALDALYGKTRDQAFAAGERRINEANTTAARDLKFELLARGLNGGSVAVDQGSLLQRKYDEGRLDLGGKADSATASLRAGDEGARLQLLQSIDNGMDQGSALSSALAQMKNNADKAGAEALGTNVGDIFLNAGLLYDQGRRARGEQKANDWMSQYFGGGGSSRGRGAPAGIFSRTEG